MRALASCAAIRLPPVARKLPMQARSSAPFSTMKPRFGSPMSAASKHSPDSLPGVFDRCQTRMRS